MQACDTLMTTSGEREHWAKVKRYWQVQLEKAEKRHG
jgi:hypothetical protein